MAMTTFFTLGPNSATSDRARMKPGMAMRPSMNLMMTSSSRL